MSVQRTIANKKGVGSKQWQWSFKNTKTNEEEKEEDDPWGIVEKF